MFTLSRHERLQVITQLSHSESVSLSIGAKNIIAETWAMQANAPLMGIGLLNIFSTSFIKVFGIEGGLFIILRCPLLGRAFRTWMFSLIGMAINEE
jgi:hypothetical protein